MWKLGSDASTEVSITYNSFGRDFNEDILNMTSTPTSVTVITKHRTKSCTRCRIVYPLHPNVMSYQASDCEKTISESLIYSGFEKVSENTLYIIKIFLDQYS